MEITTYRCKNGYEWQLGDGRRIWPYLEVECLNKKWSRSELPNCVKRKCGLERPTEWGGMDIDWPYKRRDLGDEIVYHCPNNKLTWEESLDSQSVRCIWHRQSDTMMWWPQNLKQCNSEYFKR